MPVYSSTARHRVGAIDRFLRQIHGVAGIARAVPEPESADSARLSASEQALVCGLMRVNHCGEICAQALYLGQSLLAREPELREFFRTAAAEEQDHMAWCLSRLYALQSGPSRLAPLWFMGSMLIGILAAIAGDKVSLGFLSETERQVVEHLQGHLDRLPMADLRSRAILRQMLQEESGHIDSADSRGAIKLPLAVRTMMRLSSRLMTSTTFYV